MKRYITFILSLFVLLSFVGCSNQNNPSVTETDEINNTTETTTFQDTSPVIQETVPKTEPTTPPTEAETVLHSGLCEDGSFSSGTLFIGDSLTYTFTGSYLPENGFLGEAKYAAQCGSQVTAFFDSTVLVGSNSLATRYSKEFEGMEFDEAAAFLGEKAEAIYLMWGTNYTPDATEENYIEIVDFLLEKCPNATIHLQTIPHGNVKYTIVNQRVRDAYSHYQQTGEIRVLLIDTYSAIGNHTVDGVHLGLTGNTNWYKAIVDHAAANGLSK